MTLPTGPAIAFLFTDIEGSTRLERSVGAERWAEIVGRHDALLRDAIEAAGGVVVKTEGDAFFAAFDAAAAAVAGAVEAQRALAHEPWPGDLQVPVRMGIHLGDGRLRAGRAAGEPADYVGIDVNYAARIAAAGNGGQIVLSEALVDSLPRNIARLPGLADVVLEDDGPRAVKDFDEPRPLYRLVVPGAADDTRPLRTTEIPSNLPGDLTSFVGREDEVKALAAALREHRIVTLTGPGGSGKTRLGLATARAVRERFPHGTWFVDLAAVRDPSLLEPVIASTLGVRESPERAAPEALRDHLRPRTVLLVLDNLEQLLPEAAAIVARLLRDAPGLRVIATSRELLRVTGERAHGVPPLDVDAGVALFLDRARAQRPDAVLDDGALDDVRAISERLGGLPLAIELAAARVRLLTPRLILERLGRSLDLGGGARDLPERQQTLRAAMAWSYELLPAPEQRLFARLSAFADGWSTEGAAAVADLGGVVGIDALAGLESLADKSLVRVDDAAGRSSPGAPPRFSMHPLLREFGLEQLGELGEREMTDARAAEVCAALAERVGPMLIGPASEGNLALLDRESGNLRAAVEWSIRSGEPSVGLRIVGATWRWHHQRGSLREARGMLVELLPRAAEVEPRIRLAALAAEGGLAYWMNDVDGARLAYERRLRLASATADPVLLADAHYDLGFIGMMTQDEGFLREHEERALDLYTRAGREDGALLARQGLVLAVFLGGDYVTARELETQNLEVFRRRGLESQVADSTQLLASIHWRIGDRRGAWDLAREGLALFAASDSASGIARALGVASIVMLADGDAEMGARTAGAVYRLVREKGVMLAPVHVLHLPEPRDLAVERLGPERASTLLAEGDATPLAEIIALVLATTWGGTGAANAEANAT